MKWATTQTAPRVEGIDAAQRAEHESHHEQGDRDRDHLALGEVFVVDLLRVVVDRGEAGEVGGDAGQGRGRGADVRRLLRRVLVFQWRVDLGVGDGG
jgi:hypothetical protein